MGNCFSISDAIMPSGCRNTIRRISFSISVVFQYFVIIHPSSVLEKLRLVTLCSPMTRFSLFSDTIPVGNNICSIIQYIQVSESFTRFDISCTHKGCAVFMRHSIIVLPYFLASSTDLVFAFCFR